MRRRRQKSTWFPVLGTDNGGEFPLSSIFFVNTDVAPGYGPSTFITPLIPDYTEDPSVTSGEPTLRDFVEGQTCVIDRIVGKITCHLEQFQNSEAENKPILAACCAAVAVLPVDDAGTPITTPTGVELNPLAAENLDKPWLWRRTWILANNKANVSTFPYVGSPTNTQYGAGLQEGSHIDTKGVRRAIQRNQRIYLILATQDVTSFELTDTASEVHWSVDLRVLGRMRRAKNRSLFT